MARQIPCGIAIPQTFDGPSAAVLDLNRFLPRAEALGFDSLWVQEQIVSDSAILEPVALLTYAAALTSRMRLGSAVLLTVIRNPVQLAKELATLDQLSQGRLIAGVGVGGAYLPERVFGVPTEHRGRRFVETIQVLKALWTQPRASVAGQYWNFENVPMEPKPVQRPHPPIWLAARDPMGIRRAVRHGDGWMGAGSSSSSDFVQQAAQMYAELERAGRDPASFPMSKRVYLAVDADRARAEARLRQWFAERYHNAEMAARVALWGTPAQITEALLKLIAAGATHLLLNPVFDHAEQMEILAGEVVPHLSAKQGA
ncbi:MAG TPA: LLM class flavin-dependent oxidoreductase [Candidatus Binataceae bacterium]|nr:LLM class flavin-dependent oxidoreductase [Candidatus Binataceae bacterium]